MKKASSLLIAIMILVSYSMTAYADSYISAGETQAQSTVQYTVESHFVVIIPAIINANEEYTFTASSMKIGADEQVNIYCLDMRDGGTIAMTSDSGKTASLRFSGYDSGNIVGAFTQNQLTSSFSVSAAMDDFELDPGTYTGTATFFIRLTELNNFNSI